MAISESVQVPPGAAVRKMDERDYITVNGISVIPGEPPNPIQLAHCKEWIKRFARPRKSINLRAFSYSLKHRAENWRSGLLADSKFVSNGAFILAALQEGYKYLPDGGKNCFFDMRFTLDGK
jgi:hypothetical protein